MITASLAVVISGCAKEPTDGADSASPEPAVTSSATPTSTPSATPIPTPSLPATQDSAVTCDTIFTDEVYAKWAADGLTFRDEATVVDPRLQHLVDSGMTCKWVKPSTDAYAWYAQWPSDEAEWEAIRAELLNSGYTEIAEPFPGILEAPRDPEYKPALVYRDGVVRYSSSAQWLGSVRALQ